MSDPTPEDRARADIYGLLATLLAVPPSAEILTACAKIEGDPSTPIGAALTGIAAAAGRTDAQSVEREFNALFIGVGRGELLPYASHYLTGHLNDRPLANLRKDMNRLGITRAANVFEPEDNVASVLEMLGGQIVGAYGAPAPVADQAAFFDAHLSSWGPQFFADLEKAEAATFYIPVGTLGIAFLDIEARAFAMD